MRTPSICRAGMPRDGSPRRTTVTSARCSAISLQQHQRELVKMRGLPRGDSLACALFGVGGGNVRCRASDLDHGHWVGRLDRRGHAVESQGSAIGTGAILVRGEGQERDVLNVKQGARILVVEDDRFVREMIVFALAAAGYKPMAAADGLEALAKCSRSDPKPNLILLDVRMPRMNAFVFRDALSRIPALDAIPVVVVTAVDMRMPESSAQLLRAACHLKKPVDIDHLLDVVSCSTDDSAGESAMRAKRLGRVEPFRSLCGW